MPVVTARSASQNSYSPCGSRTSPSARVDRCCSRDFWVALPCACAPDVVVPVGLAVDFRAVGRVGVAMIGGPLGWCSGCAGQGPVQGVGLGVLVAGEGEDSVLD